MPSPPQAASATSGSGVSAARPVGAAAAPPAKSKRASSGLRRGKWTPEEEGYVSSANSASASLFFTRLPSVNAAPCFLYRTQCVNMTPSSGKPVVKLHCATAASYALRLIAEFKVGLLPLTDGTTLRTFLSKLLHCDPMRISKKFVGANCIGKQVGLTRHTTDQIPVLLPGLSTQHSLTHRLFGPLGGDAPWLHYCGLAVKTTASARRSSSVASYYVALHYITPVLWHAGFPPGTSSESLLHYGALVSRLCTHISRLCTHPDCALISRLCCAGRSSGGGRRTWTASRPTR